MICRVKAIAGRYKGIQFKATVSDATKPAIDLQLEFLESAMSAGLQLEPSRLEVFVAGIPIDIREAEDGWLELFEPDFYSLPIATKEGFDQSLRLMTERLRIQEKLQITQPFVPNLIGTCTACTRWKSATHLSIRRESPIETNSRDTGWVIDCVDDQHDHNDVANIEVISAYELIIRYPRIFSILALPIGSQSILVDGDISSVTKGS